MRLSTKPRMSSRPGTHPEEFLVVETEGTYSRPELGVIHVGSLGVPDGAVVAQGSVARQLHRLPLAARLPRPYAQLGREWAAHQMFILMCALGSIDWRLNLGRKKFYISLREC